MARNMFQRKRFSNQFWVEVVATSVYLLNLSPTKAIINQTLFETWDGQRLFVTLIKIFGCVTYALVNFQFCDKLDEKSGKENVYISYYK